MTKYQEPDRFPLKQEEYDNVDAAVRAIALALPSVRNDANDENIINILSAAVMHERGRMHLHQQQATLIEGAK